MATGVKGRRPREGRGGQARTRLARRAVIQAARVLFLERGYAATTIEAIGGESGVPPATVYRLFSSKLGILKALLDVSIAGDDEAVPLQNRPQARALFDDPDPRNQLAGFAASVISPTGTLRKNTHRQPGSSISEPPGSSPVAAPSPAHTPRARVRSRCPVNVVSRIGREDGDSSAPAGPWTPRAAASAGPVGATAHAAEVMW